MGFFLGSMEKCSGKKNQADFGGKIWYAFWKEQRSVKGRTFGARFGKKLGSHFGGF